MVCSWKRHRIYFSFFISASELEILKQVFLDKEHELTIALNKVDELTKQLDQLRKIKITTNKEHSQNRNELDKLKQELMVKKYFVVVIFKSSFFFFRFEIN